MQKLFAYMASLRSINITRSPNQCALDLEGLLTNLNKYKAEVD